MKYRALIFFLAAVIVLSSVYILFENVFIAINENMHNDNQPDRIGNYTSMYFYYLGMAILKNERLNFGNEFIGAIDKDFIKHFPKDVPPETYKINKEFLNNGIDEKFFNDVNSYAIWSINDIKQEKFWLIMKPLIQNIYEDAFLKSGIVKSINYPVIHFRCADTPFIKHFQYHFQKYSYYKDALDEISSKIKKYDKVIISYCSNHQSSKNEQDACDKYADNLMKYLSTLGYESIIMCESILDDFATLYYAPAVISTGSSFSFMSGFFSKGLFISAGHQDEGKDAIKDAGDWLYKGYNVMHSEISDYHDTTTVIKKLYE